MLSALDWAVGATALLAGVTGTWSPCGLSTIETLGVGGMHEGGRRTAAGASVSFSAGAVAGGVFTFGLLSLVGALASVGGGGVDAGVALVIAAAAALLEATGTRIVPQVRRQVPESWRRSLPLTAVAGLYGGLLGLGFTTFVMTFAVWALAGIVVVLGSVHLGILVGVAFGVGRALPVALLSPMADSAVGEWLLDTMTQRRGALRGLRLADAGALTLCALALAGPAGAAVPAAQTSYSGEQDPSAVLGQLAWEAPGVGGFLRSGGQTHQLPGEHPALGGGLVAWLAGTQVTVANRLTLAPEFTVATPGADELAVSDTWLVYRVPPHPGAPARYTLYAMRIPPSAPPQAVASSAAPFQLGRPSLYRNLLVFHAAGRQSRILEIDLTSAKVSVLRSDPFAQLLNPSLQGDSLLYVRTDDCRQQLMLGPASGDGRSDRTILSAPTQVARDGGYGPGAIREGRTPNHCVGPPAPGPRTTILDYWTTALSPTTAYVTELSSRASASRARLRGLGV